MVRCRRLRRLTWRLLSLAISTLLCLFILELALRLAGFSYELRFVQGSKTLEVKHGRGIVRYVVNRDYIWVPRYYPQWINETLASSPDVLCLGDSCTELGSYPQHFSEMASDVYPDVHIAKFGVMGWSTHQGLKLMKQDIIRIKPRVVTLCFGWNDHWNNIGVPDDEVTAIIATPVFRLRHLRLGQLMMCAYAGFRHKDQVPLRVPPNRFRANLLEMVNVARDNGITPILLTAPASHESGSEPKALSPLWITDLNELVPLHRQYVDIVRSVAREQNVILCDLTAEFDALPRERVHDMFWKDGVHLTEDGNQTVARLLFECFEANGVLRTRMSDSPH